jgi:serpin B
MMGPTNSHLEGKLDMGWKGVLCVSLAFVAVGGGCKKERPQDRARSSVRTETRTLLHQAAENGNVDAVRSLTARGDDVNARDANGETPLHKAAGNAPIAVIEMLIAKGADVNAKDGFDQVPLDKVFQGDDGREEVAALLMRSGTKATVGHLISAAGAGYVRLAQSSIEQGVDVNGRSWNGRTALHVAANRGQKEAARLLLAKGADVNARTRADWHADALTPLHEAARSGHCDMAELLISGGANVNANDVEGRTPLHAAVAARRYEVARLLIGKGASVNVRDNGGDSPLYTAVASGDGRIVQLLVQAGANVKEKGPREQTLLHTAVLSLDSFGATDTVSPLITAGVDVNALASSDFTALHYAAREGHIRAAEVLLAHGANVNARTASGQTPLHFAVRRDCDDIAALLVEKGADTTIKDRRGKTPLDYANPAKHETFAALLTGTKVSDGGRIEWEEPATESGAIRPPERRREPQTDTDRLVAGNCAFAVDLYRKLSDGEGSLFFSPYSISTALAMTYAGAREKTEEQMAKTLHFPVDQQRLHPAFAELQGTLNNVQEAGNVRLCLANALWPQEGHPFLPAYLSLVEKHYGVSITAVDYRTDGAREAARQTINRWVEDRTEDRIKELILPGHLTDATRLVLTNAVSFKGKWHNEFDPKDTKDATFFLSPSRSVQVPTMHQEEEFGYAEMKSLQILEMPYRGGELSMLVLLPTRIEGLRQLERSLTAEALQNWRSHLTRRKVIVFLPRFKTTFRVELKETLRSMGMVDPFQWPGANFAGLDGDPNWFYIGQVVHKAYADVNEEGTEAAAATAVVMMLGGMGAQPPVFRADHPFLFLIQENSTGSILFLGRMADPTQAGQ